MAMSEWSDVLEVRCGWSEPDLADEIKFNFHINMYQKLSWRVTLDFRDIMELRNNIHAYTEEISIEAQFPVINTVNAESMLRRPQLQLENVRVLSQISRQLETWMNAVMLSLPYLDRESQAMCKQLFFRDLSRIPLYESLYRSLQVHEMHNNTTTTTQPTIQFKENSNNRQSNILYAVTKLFSRKKESTTAPVLTSSNLRTLPSKPPPSVPGPPSVNNQNKSKKFGFGFGIRSARSVTSAKDSQKGDFKSALDVAQNSVLLRIDVQRGHEIKQGVLCYQISLIATGKMVKAPIVYAVYERYNNFKRLFLKLNEINDEVTKVEAGATPSPYSSFMWLLAAPFPVAPMKSYFGLALNDSELSMRTRMLDAWFRDVCANYRNMPTKARLAIRTFLSLDMEKKKGDQFFQDQLVWGAIENNNGTSSNAVIVGHDGQAEVSSMSYSYTARPSVHAAAPPADRLSRSMDPSSAAHYTRDLRAAIADETASETKTLSGRRNVRFAADRPLSLGQAPHGSATGSAQSQAVLSNLVWETASQGGASRIPKRLAPKASRANVFQKKGQYLPEEHEGEDDDG